MESILSDELYEHHSFKVEKKHDLIRIDKFLLLRIPNTSRTKIQKSILSGHVFCNDNQVKANYRVKPLDQISIRFEYEPYNKEIIPELLQSKCNPKTIYNTVDKLLNDEKVLKEQLAKSQEIIKNFKTEKSAEISSSVLLNHL